MKNSQHAPGFEVKNLELKIGPYQIHSIPTGLFRLDGGAMFGTVPKVLWQRTNPADEDNRILMESRALLLTSPEKKILIDTGNGGDFVAKYGERAGKNFESIYGVDSGEVSLQSSLKKYGLKPADITDVILTHLHFDHAGGATCEKNGQLVPSFENATYYVQEENLKNAQNPNRRERASYLAPNFEPLIKHKVLKVLNGPHEIIDSVSAVISHGHTQGQQSILISDNKTHLLYCADLIPTSTHIKLAWVMGYDIQPTLLIEEKEKTLKLASQEKWYLFFEHDPYFEAVQVSEVEKRGRFDFEVTQRYNLV